MANGRLLIDPASDQAGLVATSEETGFDIENIQNQQPKKVWRSTSDVLHNIDVTFATAQSIDAFALINHNLSADGTVALKSYTNSGRTVETSSNTWDVEPIDGAIADGWTSTVNNRNNVGVGYFVRWPASVSSAWWRIIIDDTTNPDGYLEIGRMMMGAAWSPTKNFNWGSAIGTEDPSPLVRTYGSSLYADARQSFRIAAPRWEWLTAAEYDAIVSALFRCGSQLGALWAAYPGDTDETLDVLNTFYGRILDWSQPARLQRGTFALEMTIAEGF